MGLRRTSLALVTGLIAIGLFASSPFLCDRLVGTGESFNYSLSVADSLQQMRAGTVPPLVGQGVYAFNGRIHPLRNAPYLYYLAAAIDIATRHTLDFWAIQNASLTFSLVAAALACYLGLRRGVECPPVPAFLLSAVYALSPALLGAAYSYDLFMTVHAAPFVPLAVGACMRGCIRPSFSADAWLAAALAGAWLAHPPVALWLTSGVLVVRMADFLLAPKWRTLANGTCAVLLGAALASFVFVSVLTLNSDLSLLSSSDLYGGVADSIVQVVQSAFPASLLPVGSQANGVGDLQFGYAAWLILPAAVFFLIQAARGKVALGRSARVAATASLAYAALLLVLVLPVPVLNPFLWRHVPHVMVAITNTWPMQRFYLVAVPFTLFSAAVVLPVTLPVSRTLRWMIAAAVALGAVWCVHEASLFVTRGKLNRRTSEVTETAYRPSNLDLTLTSYSYFGVPPSFTNGVMDPAFGFRLLRGGTEELDSPAAAAARNSPIVDRGDLKATAASFFTLLPGRRYLLSFAFQAAPANGFIQLIGPLIQRGYTLPSAGQRRGFGMKGGNSHSIPVWTDGDSPERVGMRLGLIDPGAQSDPRTFATYTLQEVRPEDVSIRLDSLIPLRFTVEAPESGCTVETPRCFISGYTATANGARVIPVMSPDRMVMVPVPPGHSVVELKYEGSPALRGAFWLSFASWAAFILWRLSGSPMPSLAVGSTLRRSGWLMRHRTPAVILLACLAATIAAAWRLHSRRQYLAQVGPMQVDFALPYGKIGVRQPLLTTGHPAAAAVVNVMCVDPSHVRLGADVWGRYFQSEPIALDFSQIQSLVVSDSALFPAEHPAVRTLSSPEQAKLRGELRVELNGRIAIMEDSYAYETTKDEMEVGTARFGSMAEPRFSGEILGARHLPIPRRFPLPRGRNVHMELKFPTGQIGKSEPLLSTSSGGVSCACFVTYLTESTLRLTLWSPDGVWQQSRPIRYDPEASHSLDFVAGEAGSPGTGYRLGCEFDGDGVFDGSSLRPPGVPSLAVAGLNLAEVPGVSERFTGRRMDVSMATALPAQGPVGRRGTVHMIVSFPEHKDGRSEPLLTTGHNGAGDIIYVTYVDNAHVRLGFDHWGGAGAISPSVPIDYGVPHEIWITTSSIDRSGNPPANPKVEALLDAKPVIVSEAAPYPAAPGEVACLRNPIGASTCDPEFSGATYFVERVGMGPVRP